MTAESLTICCIYGEFSTAIHGAFDLPGLYTRVGLTGSESSFFNLARSLAEAGHRVVAFCVCDAPYDHPSGLAILPIQMLENLHQLENVSAVIAWNEPDYLRFAPEGVPCLVAQQLNDWGYCGPGWYKASGSWMGQHMDGQDWHELVDGIVFPSESSEGNHVPQVRGMNLHVIPNSVDLDLFMGAAAPRNPHRAVWCSSPDRGLHHVISLWPEIRRRVPDAELRIFYRLKPWLDRARDLADEVGKRARYIEEGLHTLTRGNFGVTVCDLVPNVQMARELRQAGVLIYPCDPVRYTEGFGCSVLDAAAGGCVPIISDADALAEVHGEASAVVKGNPGNARAAWLEAVEYLMNLDAIDPSGKQRREIDKRMAAHAQKHSRLAVAEQWIRLLNEMR